MRFPVHVVAVLRVDPFVPLDSSFFDVVFGFNDY